MAKKVKQFKKPRVQIRLGDIYRYIVTGELAPIHRINSIYFKKGTLVLDLDNFCTYTFAVSNENGTQDEKLLRSAIKEINKLILEV